MSPRPPLSTILAGKGVSKEAFEATVRRAPSGVDLGASSDGRYRSDSAFESRYAVAGELARGGMGIILDGKDLQIRRELAIKVLIDREADADQVARSVEEAQVQGQLEHPNICPVHELGRDAVAFAHSRGVIHRDLKPENVMIGEFGEVLVMDWGLAKIVGREDRNRGRLVVSTRGEESLDGSVMGTPAYMPPEQARGALDEIDERSDVYALGGILLRDPDAPRAPRRRRRDGDPRQGARGGRRPPLEADARAPRPARLSRRGAPTARCRRPGRSRRPTKAR